MMPLLLSVGKCANPINSLVFSNKESTDSSLANRAYDTTDSAAEDQGKFYLSDDEIKASVYEPWFGMTLVDDDDLNN